MKKGLTSRLFSVALAAALCAGMVLPGFAEGEQPSDEAVSEAQQTPVQMEVQQITHPTNPNGLEVFASSWYQGTEEEWAKVYELADQCRKAGVTSELGIALWMHDWLVYNANYDLTYTEYYPEGVLLKGTGVCQSYALAYEMLMKAMGVECETLFASEMNHAWNLVKINGSWCHVDCTWDDPIMNDVPGGGECYDYFGLNDALMSRDHQWNRSAYVSCTSLNNFYFKLSGGGVVSDEEDLYNQLSLKAEAGDPNFTFTYIGEDPDFDIFASFQTWFDENSGKYGIGGLGGSCSQFTMKMKVGYWSGSAGEGDPIYVPSFVLEGMDGLYRSGNYSSNGLMLICGTADNQKTTELMDLLNEQLETLYAGGVEVLVSLNGIDQPEQLRDLQTRYPNMHLTCGSSRLRSGLLSAIGTEASPYFPVAVVADKDGRITYYDTDTLDSQYKLVSAGNAVATGNPLPAPIPVSNQGDVDVALETITGSAVVSELDQLSKQHNGLVFLYSGTCAGAETQQLEAWQSNARLMNALDMRMVVCIHDFDDATREQYAQAYPDILFLADDGAVYMAMRNAAGISGAEGRALSCYWIDGKGTVTSYSWRTAMDLMMCAERVARGLPCDAKMPADLTEIRQEAFLAAGLQGVDLTGSSVTEIGARAFAENEKLALAILPESVTQIAEDAFEGCGNLVILARAGSAAYQFAEANGIPVLADKAD